MSNVVIVGAQWGDEGKGKIVDILTESADVVVRFQGGPNAGHTVVIGDKQIILHQIPSGILHEEKSCVVGSGCVLDIETLLNEIEEVKNKGFFHNDACLLLSEEAHLIMPYHKKLDVAGEKKRAADKIGTTGRGIGPAYEDKVARKGIRLIDIYDDGLFRKKLKSNLEEKNFYIGQYLKEDIFDMEKIIEQFFHYRDKIKQYLSDTSVFLQESISQKKRILFEGAQGTMLDVNHGTYPFVTSSNTVAAQASIGSGLGPRYLNTIVGIAKAYTTRVGEGPFPTEDKNEFGDYLREKGREYGSTTGRPRRCGWFDMVVARHSIRMNSMTHLILTKLDVLSGLKNIKICTGYKYKGKLLRHIPSNIRVMGECRPVYEELEGWGRDIRGVKDFDDLPSAAKSYVRFIEKQAGIPVIIISLGNRRDEAMMLQNPFALH